MDLKTRIKVALGIEPETEQIKLEYQAKLVDGTIIVSTADELAAGVDIMILTEDGTTMPLPKGKYETEDGVGFSVEEDGIVAEIYEDEAVEEEEVVEEIAEVEEEEMTVEREPKKVKRTEEYEFDKEGIITEIGAVVKELLAEVKSDLERLDAELKDMKGENEDLKNEVELAETEKAELQAQVVELSKEPASKPVEVNKFTDKKTKLSSKNYNELTRKEKFWYNIENR
jgi:hypothetical protein|tara:strand:- start:12310 stop:12993 length:684 start_codon:yes stop_codon:yes gene_type:complete